MTNLERFQSMTAEEFAKTFEEQLLDLCCTDYIHGCHNPDLPCSECVLEYLLKEVTTNERD